MAVKAADLMGKRFGRLTVIGESNKIGGHKYWHCKCDCGKEINVRAYSLTSGDSKSCGCLVKDINRKRNTKHGGYGTRLYRIWDDMKSRCRNPNSISYPNYGGKGITICNEWNNFAVFREWAINNGYNDKLTIDRIDNSKGYTQSNCRWVNMIFQENNKASNHYVSYNGETLSLSMWARRFNISYNMLLKRILRGWSFEKAIKTPPSKRKVG